MAAQYSTAVPGLELRFGGVSDPGQRRKNNEDAQGFVTDEATGAFLLVVADGVGGNAAGEVASRIAVDTWCEHFAGLGEAEDPVLFMRQGMEAANLAIYENASQNPLHSGMATTCTTVLIRGEELRVAHVGDCRAYLVHEGQLYQLTDDHSAGAEYEKQGLQLPPEKAHLHNVLTRCLGIEPTVRVDVVDPVAFQQDSLVVVCSDGLLKVVESEEILHTVAMHLPERASQRLVDMANERGGPDNITVQVARYCKG